MTLHLSTNSIHNHLTTIYTVRQHRRPKYLLNLLTDYVPARILRSSNTNLLTAPPDVKTATVSHTFWATALKLGNNLPLFVKSSCSYHVFKRRLKSYLFAQVFT